MPDFRLPNESDEYRSARSELLQAEIALRQQEELVAELRRTLPPGGLTPTDYEFEQWDLGTGASGSVRMSELFEEGKDTLYLYSFMIVPQEQGLPFVGPCPSCTSIIDAVDGELPHITQRINLAVVTKPPIERVREHAKARGWRHAKLLSSNGNTYNRDYGSEDENGFQWPIATVFHKTHSGIRHFWSSELFFAPHDEGQGPRHVDFMWPLWAILDRTPESRGTRWNPELNYD